MIREIMKFRLSRLSKSALLGVFYTPWSGPR